MLSKLLKWHLLVSDLKVCKVARARLRAMVARVVGFLNFAVHAAVSLMACLPSDCLRSLRSGVFDSLVASTVKLGECAIAF